MRRLSPNTYQPASDLASLKEPVRHGTAGFPLQVYTGYADSMQREVLHWHEEMEAIWMPAPGGRITVNGKVHEVNADTVFFIHPGEIHSWDSRGRGSARAAAIVFHWRLLDLINGSIRERYLQPLALGSMRLPRKVAAEPGWQAELCGHISKLVAEISSQQPARELSALAHLYSVLALIARADALQATGAHEAQKKQMKVARIRKALQYIIDNYQSKLSVAQLAKITGLSTFHFSREFKTVTNQTPVGFIHRYRVERAAELLKDPQKGILEISLDVGFSHLSYFNKIFKRIMGCSPSKYRASLTPMP